MTSDDSRETVLAALIDLHAEIDREAARLADRHANRLQCGRGCQSCCVDELSVMAIEAERIQDRHGEWLERAEPHPPGACAFLDQNGACRIYSDRPSVCRSQGLPLRVLYEEENDEIGEIRDICPLNLDGGPALVDLPEDDLWLIGPYELRLAELDRRLNEQMRNEERPRIALRSLFKSSLGSGS